MQEECIWHAFLKTGFDGVKHFENAVLVDILVRPIRIGITVLIATMPFIEFGINIWSVFDVIMVSSIVSVGSLNIFRYMDMGMYIYLLALIFVCPAIVGSIAVLIYGGNVVYRTCVSSGACRSDSSDILSYDDAYPQIIC